MWGLQDAGPLPGPSGLLDQLAAISETFMGRTLEDIYAALRARGDAWSRDTLAALSKWAPLSVLYRATLLQFPARAWKGGTLHLEEAAVCPAARCWTGLQF